MFHNYYNLNIDLTSAADADMFHNVTGKITASYFEGKKLRYMKTGTRITSYEQKTKRAQRQW